MPGEAPPTPTTVGYATDRCVHCGYSLEGSEINRDGELLCPECGKHTTPSEWADGVRDTSFKMVFKRCWLIPTLCAGSVPAGALILWCTRGVYETAFQMIIGIVIFAAVMLGLVAPFLAIATPLAYRDNMRDRYVSAPQLCGKRLWFSTLSCIAVLLTVAAACWYAVVRACLSM